VGHNDESHPRIFRNYRLMSNMYRLGVDDILFAVECDVQILACAPAWCSTVSAVNAMSYASLLDSATAGKSAFLSPPLRYLCGTSAVKAWFHHRSQGIRAPRALNEVQKEKLTELFRLADAACRCLDGVARLAGLEIVQVRAP